MLQTLEKFEISSSFAIYVLSNGIQVRNVFRRNNSPSGAKFGEYRFSL